MPHTVIKKIIYLVIIIVVWLGISTYFYFQHSFTVKSVTIPGWELLDDLGVQIKEIRVIKNQPKYKMSFDSTFNKFLFESNLPHSILNLIFRVKNFYTLPVSKRDMVELKGITLKNNNKENGLDFPRIHLYLNGFANLLTSAGRTASESSNLVYFTRSGSNYTDNEVEQIKVILFGEDEEIHLEWLSSDFKTDDYNFFNRAAVMRADMEYVSFQPDAVVSEVFYSFYRGENVDNMKLDAGLLERLRWVENYQSLRGYSVGINYIGSYKDYNHVFEVNMVYHENMVDDILADQNFCLVEEKEAWKIIDISPINFH